MEMSRWLFEMEMEDSTFFNQYQMDYSDDLTPEQLAAAFGEDNQQTYSSESFSSYPDFSPLPIELEEATPNGFKSATKKRKTTTDGRSSSTIEPIFRPDESSFPTMLSFGNSNPLTGEQLSYGVSSVCVNPKEKVVFSTKKRACVPSTTAKDHVIAERKRREKLSERFIALSAVVPGLKKMDKTSVLEDCIKYIKKLQERVKALEEQTAKTTMESVVYIKKFYIQSDNDSSSTEDISQEPLPEIHARALEKNVLIKIHCENQTGITGKVLEEIEKLNLSVENSSIFSFGTSTLDITVMAQIDEGYELKVVDLVKKLHLAFQKFM